MQLAPSMARLGTETAFEVLLRAKALEAKGRSVIHLEIGEPDFATPVHIREAAKQALDEGWTHYCPTAGLPELRQSIADYTNRTRGLNVGPERVVVTPGGKPIIFFPMLALLKHGDEVIYPNPGFPIYESMINYAGATPVAMPLREERGFSFDVNEFRSKLTSRTRMVILNSPHNPTGGVIPEADIAAVAEMLAHREVMILSDEIYARLSYGQTPVSITAFPGMLDKTIILDGFSKTWAMTGWRMGWGVMPEWLAKAVTQLMVNSNSCTSSFTQRAGLAALDGTQAPVDEMLAEFRRRRAAFVAGLNTIPGFRCPMPEGAFYAFPNIEGTGWASKSLADAILEKAGVACLSGTAFGKYGEGYLRLSYANSYDKLMEAVERIRKFIAE